MINNNNNNNNNKSFYSPIIYNNHVISSFLFLQTGERDFPSHYVYMPWCLGDPFSNRNEKLSKVMICVIDGC